MTLRLVLIGMLGLAAYFAFFGGEYSVADMQRIRAASNEAQQELELRAAALQARAAWADSLERDPRVLEGLARERFGMVRNGEILYRFADLPGTPDGG